MIITFTDESHGTLHVLASCITSMRRVPADAWPERTLVTTSCHERPLVFEDSREDFGRNLSAWHAAVTPKPTTSTSTTRPC